MSEHATLADFGFSAERRESGSYGFGVVTVTWWPGHLTITVRGKTVHDSTTQTDPSKIAIHWHDLSGPPEVEYRE
jgi:hypothetical protein